VSFHLQPLNHHPIVRRANTQMTPRTQRTTGHFTAQQIHVLLTVMAPHLRLLLTKMQDTTFRQRAATHQLKTERQRLRFDTGKCSSFQPHSRNPLRAMLPSLLLHHRYRVLAQSDLMHNCFAPVIIALSKQCKEDASNTPLFSDIPHKLTY
jgi:hypothetical protein